MLILPFMTGCTGTEPGAAAASETDDVGRSAIVCGDDLPPSYHADYACERWAGYHPWLPQVDLDGTTCISEESTRSTRYCQLEEPLEAKCDELYERPCPTFLELLDTSGWLDGEPQYLGMYAYAHSTIDGPDYDVIFYTLEEPLWGYGLLHFFHPSTGDLLAIELMNYWGDVYERWCCQGLTVSILTWGEWSHLPDDEDHMYVPEDFQTR